MLIFAVILLERYQFYEQSFAQKEIIRFHAY